MKRFEIGDQLAREMRARLGVPRPRSVDDVHALYRAWCERVPFDGVAKALAVAEGRVPPGADAEEFCERWLGTGLGGTCWGHVAALAALLGEAGIRSTVGIDRMLRDDLVDFHSFLLVDPEVSAGRRRAAPMLMADPIHVSGALLPFVAGARGTHPVYEVGIDEVDGRLEHWYVYPAQLVNPGRYAVLSTQLDAADVRAFCEVSVKHSGVRGQFFARTTAPTSILAARPTDEGDLHLRRWHAGGLDESVVDLEEGLRVLGVNDDGLASMATGALIDRDATGRWRFTAAAR